MGRGVYKAVKKDGSVYYRVSLYHNRKHISLGSYDDEATASKVFNDDLMISNDTDINILNLFSRIRYLPHDKAVSLLNQRDNKTYIKTPIYLQNGFFSYFLDGVGELKFDNDDLFYYSSHRILVHDGHMYVNDYGSQYGILSRFGIKNYAVAGRDYIFANGDSHDLRYSNVIVINRYHGVTRVLYHDMERHEVKIHINGDFLIGRFKTDSEAAVAYNKAADAATDAGIRKEFIQNYVSEYSPREYAEVYTAIQLPEKYLRYLSTYHLK